jgi:hypothetical protein
MRNLATIHPPNATRKILECLGLPSRAPPTAAPRPEADVPQAQATDFEAEADV